MNREQFAIQMAEDMERFHEIQNAIGPFGELAIFAVVVLFVALLIIPNKTSS